DKMCPVDTTREVKINGAQSQRLNTLDRAFPVQILACPSPVNSVVSNCERSPFHDHLPPYRHSSESVLFVALVTKARWTSGVVARSGVIATASISISLSLSSGRVTRLKGTRSPVVLRNSAKLAKLLPIGERILSLSRSLSRFHGFLVPVHFSGNTLPSIRCLAISSHSTSDVPPCRFSPSRRANENRWEQMGTDGGPWEMGSLG
ncbi:hypothetical protein K0M31_006501, partial [Melipona bicolor]